MKKIVSLITVLLISNNHINAVWGLNECMVHLVDHTGNNKAIKSVAMCERYHSELYVSGLDYSEMVREAENIINNGIQNKEDIARVTELKKALRHYKEQLEEIAGSYFRPSRPLTDKEFDFTKDCYATISKIGGYIYQLELEEKRYSSLNNVDNNVENIVKKVSLWNRFLKELEYLETAFYN